MSAELFDQDHERFQRIVDLQTQIRAVADHLTGYPEQADEDWLLFEVDMAGHWGAER